MLRQMCFISSVRAEDLTHKARDIYSIATLFPHLQYMKSHTGSSHIVQNSIHNMTPGIIQPASWDSGRKCLELYNLFVIWLNLRSSAASCQGSTAAQLSGERLSVRLGGPWEEQTPWTLSDVSLLTCLKCYELWCLLLIEISTGVTESLLKTQLYRSKHILGRF